MSQPPKVKLIPLIGYDPTIAQVYYGWFNDAPLVAQIAPFGGLPQTVVEIKEWLESLATTILEKRFTVYFEGTAVGDVGLTCIDYGREEAGVSVFIGEANLRGKRLGTEALRGLIAYAFGETNLARLYLGTDGRNIPAVKAYTKLGFTEIASADLTDETGQPRHEILMELWNTEPMRWKLDTTS